MIGKLRPRRGNLLRIGRYRQGKVGLAGYVVENKVNKVTFEIRGRVDSQSSHHTETEKGGSNDGHNPE